MPTPFVKGDPRINRRGRPKKGQTLTDILDWALDQKRKIKNEETGEEKSLLPRQMLAQQLIHKAVDEGDVPAIKYIYDRIDGKPKETIEMSEKRDDIPDDPEERRALAERFRKELGLAEAPEHTAEQTATAKRQTENGTHETTA
ncbi:MAG: DUF5681 domain-containing protein [Treponema sp.]|jgi:hypothetical protein|nr:DUF5681 domain-containing protein [Treponema sp.]